MPYVVACPKCPAKLKSQQAVPAGRTVTCPQCKTTFTLSEPAQLVSDGSVTLPTGNTKPKPANPGPREPDVVDGADFEFSDKAKNKKRDDDYDDDDRPRNKKRRDDDDYDDDRPRSKKRRDDEDDDRPRGKGRRDDDREDDFDDEDRPRKKAKKGKKNNKMLLLGLIGGAGAFAMLCILLLILNLTGVFSLFSGGASSDMVAWLPSDTLEVEGVDFTEMAKNATMLKEARDDFSEVEAIGLKVEDLATGMYSRKEGGREVFIVKAKERIEKDKIVKTIGTTESTANGKRYYKTKSNGAVHFASERLVVVTKSETTMTTLLNKDDGKIVIPADLQTAIKSADGHMWAAAVSSRARGIGGDIGTGPKPTMSVMNGKIDGAIMNARMEFTYADSAAAKSAHEQFEKFITLAKLKDDGKKAAPKMFSSSTITVSGNVVTWRWSAPVDERFN